MNPVARLADPHVCPAADPKPHVGGPLLGPGAPTVLINNLPAALEGDFCTCVGTPATVKCGSSTVKVLDKALARMGDQTSHGGAIVGGSPNVLAG
jgi:uncharacterized Zn-binding protein involved in type VI secretion